MEPRLSDQVYGMYSRRLPSLFGFLLSSLAGLFTVIIFFLHTRGLVEIYALWLFGGLFSLLTVSTFYLPFIQRDIPIRQVYHIISQVTVKLKVLVLLYIWIGFGLIFGSVAEYYTITEPFLPVSTQTGITAGLLIIIFSLQMVLINYIFWTNKQQLPEDVFTESHTGDLKIDTEKLLADADTDTEQTNLESETQNQSQESDTDDTSTDPKC